MANTGSITRRMFGTGAVATMAAGTAIAAPADPHPAMADEYRRIMVQFHNHGHHPTCDRAFAVRDRMLSIQPETAQGAIAQLRVVLDDLSHMTHIKTEMAGVENVLRFLNAKT